MAPDTPIIVLSANANKDPKNIGSLKYSLLWLCLYLSIPLGTSSSSGMLVIWLRVELNARMPKTSPMFGVAIWRFWYLFSSWSQSTWNFPFGLICSYGLRKKLHREKEKRHIIRNLIDWHLEDCLLHPKLIKNRTRLRRIMMPKPMLKLKKLAPNG